MNHDLRGLLIWFALFNQSVMSGKPFFPGFKAEKTHIGLYEVLVIIQAWIILVEFFLLTGFFFTPGPPKVFIDSHKTDLMASNQRQRHLKCKNDSF